jgi:hypothetical protein
VVLGDAFVYGFVFVLDFEVVFTKLGVRKFMFVDGCFSGLFSMKV